MLCFGKIVAVLAATKGLSISSAVSVAGNHIFWN